MRVIEPSTEIIEDQLAALTIPQRIEHCGRVCYKSEAKITPDSAMPFCQKMVASGHWAVLEMAVVHLVIRDTMAPRSKFITISPLNDWGGAVVSGSIRAFIESEDEYGSPVWNFMAENLPLFFTDSDRSDPDRVRFATPEEIPDSHRHVAVKFIVNRAVSHELVRHRPCSFLQESQRYCGYSQDRFDGQVTFIEPWFYGDDPIMKTRLWEYAVEQSETAYLAMIANGATPQEARTVLPNSCKTEIIVYASLPEWRHIFSLRCSPAADPSMRQVTIPLRDQFAARWPGFFDGEGLAKTATNQHASLCKSNS